MMMHRTLIATLLPLLLCSCNNATQQSASNGSLAATSVHHSGKVSALWQANDGKQLLVAESRGMQLLDAQGQLLAQLPGGYEQLDIRPLAPSHVLAATLDEAANSVLVAEVDSQAGTLTTRSLWRLPKLQPDSLCLFADAQDQTLSVFVQDGNGAAEQWLLAQRQQWLVAPVLLRSVPQPFNVKGCATDDQQGWLYTLEEGLGIWRYNARIESAPERIPLALLSPWGQLPAVPAAISTDHYGNLFAISEDTKQLWYWPQQCLAVAKLSQPQLPEQYVLALEDSSETLVVSEAQATQQPLTLTTDQGESYQLSLSVSQRADAAVIPSVSANRETPAADRSGDVMDDPAIWFNSAAPERSLVLGTHKKDGLYVYDLQAREVARFADGKLNNVDVRNGFVYNGETIALAAASKREDNSLMFYGISKAGEVFRIGKLATELDPIYGLCMAQLQGNTYVIANDKQGHVDQYRVQSQGEQLTLHKTRRLQLASQPEGCVVDDKRQRLFLGEEDHAIWSTDADPSSQQPLQIVARVGPELVADIEGMAIAEGERPLLLVSSQGNSSYAAYHAEPPFAYVGSFRIRLDATHGIDGVSDTDGLDVLTTPLGPLYPHGLLVVQDGRNRFPEEAQNFKYLDWAEVLQQLP